ncbi:hypothetical protein DIPPA_00467 [Diplonema papillatum]|nr:hypothetical protein DIPPA_00467 [Diplonema papillatum]
MTHDSIGILLRGIGLQHLSSLLKSNGVDDADTLGCFTTDELKQLGVERHGDRMKLLIAARAGKHTLPAPSSESIKVFFQREDTLNEYLDNVLAQGIDSIQLLQMVDESALEADLGIQKPGHRKKLLLRLKERGSVPGNPLGDNPAGLPVMHQGSSGNNGGSSNTNSNSNSAAAAAAAAARRGAENASPPVKNGFSNRSSTRSLSGRSSSNTTSPGRQHSPPAAPAQRYPSYNAASTAASPASSPQSVRPKSSTHRLQLSTLDPYKSDRPTVAANKAWDDSTQSRATAGKAHVRISSNPTMLSSLSATSEGYTTGSNDGRATPDEVELGISSSSTNASLVNAALSMKSPSQFGSIVMPDSRPDRSKRANPVPVGRRPSQMNDYFRKGLDESGIEKGKLVKVFENGRIKDERGFMLYKTVALKPRETRDMQVICNVITRALGWNNPRTNIYRQGDDAAGNRIVSCLWAFNGRPLLDKDDILDGMWVVAGVANSSFQNSTGERTQYSANNGAGPPARKLSMSASCWADRLSNPDFFTGVQKDRHKSDTTVGRPRPGTAPAPEKKGFSKQQNLRNRMVQVRQQVAGKKDGSSTLSQSTSTPTTPGSNTPRTPTGSTPASVLSGSNNRSTTPNHLSSFADREPPYRPELSPRPVSRNSSAVGAAAARQDSGRPAVKQDIVHTTLTSSHKAGKPVDRASSHQQQRSAPAVGGAPLKGAAAAAGGAAARAGATGATKPLTRSETAPEPNAWDREPEITNPDDSSLTEDLVPKDLESANKARLKGWKKTVLLGRGSFGMVYKGELKDGSDCAVKIVSVSKGDAPTELQQLFREIRFIEQLEHPNIVRYFGCLYDEVEERVEIFLQLMTGGSIASLAQKHNGKIPDLLVKKFTKQILCGLEYLHKRKVVHRDVKGANVLIDDKGDCAIADFGTSKCIDDMVSRTYGCTTMVGTPYWMAPEVITACDDGAYDTKVDVWSVGCTIVEMITGNPPWSGQHENMWAAIFHIAQSTEPPPLPSDIGKGIKGFLNRCFERNPSKRPSCTELLSDKWMTEK